MWWWGRDPGGTGRDLLEGVREAVDALKGPAGALDDPVRRHWVQVLFAILGALVVLGAGLTVAMLVLSGGLSGASAPAIGVGAVCTVLLIAAFALAQTGRYRAAARLTVVIALAGTWAAALLSPGSVEAVTVLPYLAIPVALAGLFLAPYEAVLTVVAAAGSPLVAGVGLSSSAMLPLVGLLGGIGGITLAANHLIRQHHDRIQERSVDLREEGYDLEATTDRLRQAQRLAGVGVWTWTPGDGANWCRQTHAMLGRDPETVEPSTQRFLDHVHSEDRDRILEALDDVRHGRWKEGESKRFPVRLVDADGEIVHTHWVAKVLERPEGEPEFYGVVQDVTESTQIETVRRRAAEDHARTEELGEMIHITAHHYREPVRSLTTSTQLLRRQLADIDDEALDDLVATIVGSAHRLDNVTSGFIRYAEALTKPLSLAPLDVEQAVEAALDDVQAIPGADEARVEYGSLPLVVADGEALVDIFRELLQNAISHAEENVTVRVHAEREGDGWLLTVEDDGPGIDAQYHDTVLEPFQRLSRDGHAEHTGLGLALVRGLVHRHRGNVELVPCPEGGTRVEMWLPARGRVDQDPASVDLESAVGSHGERAELP